jgi:hypothetical protein
MKHIDDIDIVRRIHNRAPSTQILIKDRGSIKHRFLRQESNEKQDVLRGLAWKQSQTSESFQSNHMSWSLLTKLVLRETFQLLIF